MRILVTGAAGFLGSHIVRHLAALGHAVTGIVRNPLQAGTVDSLIGDLRDCDWVARIETFPWNCIVHCAAVLPGSFCGADALAAAAANAVIDRNVVALACRSGARLIYLSGTSLYGLNPADEPLDESAPLQPIGPYLESKVATEELLSRMLKGQAIILRISAPYGSGQRPTVMSRFVASALSGHTIELFGHGSRTQCFTHVDDVCSAVSLSAVVSGGGQVFNIAGLPSISMRNLAFKVRSVLDSTSDIIHSDAPDPQESFRANYSTRRSETLLGWRQEVGLDQGIIALANWMRTA